MRGLLLVTLSVLIGPGCSRATRYCEKTDDCPTGLTCSADQHYCAELAATTINPEDYIQNRRADMAPQSASINIAGSGDFGGRLSINSSTAGVTLDVRNQAGATIMSIGNNSGSKWTAISGGDDTANEPALFWSKTHPRLRLGSAREQTGAGFAAAVSIETTGNVGIGTTTPRSTLQVSGGYLQIPTRYSPPPPEDCDEVAEEGRMVAVGSLSGSDTNVGLHICLKFNSLPTWRWVMK